jgi:tetratricopeptide (TPR) repeat protein
MNPADSSPKALSRRETARAAPGKGARRFWNVFPALAFIILGALIYSNTLASPFHYDDRFFIVRNEAIRDLDNITSMGKGILHHSSRFLTFLTFSLNYHFHGLDPRAYRLTNIGIHLANTFLVWWLTALVFTAGKSRTGPLAEHRENFCFFTALVFLTHPVQTQAVTYISQRFASLATLFYLLSVGLYLKGRLVGNRPFLRIPLLAGAVLAGLLGMFSKEIVITLPLMIIFCETFFFGGFRGKGKGRLNRKALYFLIPALLMSLIIPALFSFQIKDMLFTVIRSQSHEGDVLTLGTYLLTEMRVFVTLLRLFVFPANQNLFYDYPMSRHLFEPAALLSVLFILALTVLAFKIKDRREMAGFGLFWFLLTLLAHLVPRSHVIWEHKLYLPSFGLSLTLSALLCRTIKNVRVTGLVMGGIVLVLSILTFQRNLVWKDEVSLWQDVTKKSPRRANAHYNLGQAHAGNRQYDEAFSCFNQAILLKRNYPEALTSRGIIHGMRGRTDLALLDFDRSLALNQNFFEAWSNRGTVKSALGDYPGAKADFDKAAALVPRDAEIYKKRGHVKYKLKDYAGAVRDLDQALELDPQDAEAYFRRGFYKEQLKDGPGALGDLRKAGELGMAEAVRLLRKTRKVSE